MMPDSEEAAAAFTAETVARRETLSITGQGTQAGMGRPIRVDRSLSSRALTGVTLHEPAELVISARAGTPVRELTEKLAAAGQVLAFEPVDLRALFGTTGEPTVGGLVAGNWAGPRRVMVGAVRDHLIGTRFVNGRGEVIKSGGRVMKNVTGLDLARLQCGAHGTLGFLTEVTFKVSPRAEASATLVYRGLDDRRAVELLTIALGSPYEVSGAAHLPPGVAGAGGRTLLRLENFAASVDYRCDRLAELTTGFGQPDCLSGNDAAELWAAIRDASILAEPRERSVWRVSVPPTSGPGVVGRLPRDLLAAHYYDWGGGLIWLAVADRDDVGASAIRAALAPCGGHATLMRAPDPVRARVDVFEPLSPPLQQVARRIKAALDPAGIFNPGRMYSDV